MRRWRPRLHPSAISSWRKAASGACHRAGRQRRSPRPDGAGAGLSARPGWPRRRGRGPALEPRRVRRVSPWRNICWARSTCADQDPAQAAALAARRRDPGQCQVNAQSGHRLCSGAGRGAAIRRRRCNGSARAAAARLSRLYKFDLAVSVKERGPGGAAKRWRGALKWYLVAASQVAMRSARARAAISCAARCSPRETALAACGRRRFSRRGRADRYGE